ncbi:adenylate cyclase [Novosphingobium cyanobacteriorum]|uniref:Adenylate cyclase n=1 Tax=Novosphingobium cyanobacteriorum TaxID=3024215 RepID=A0ABT6CGA5_9SPHN|nr:adenylate cyclase [Novosphingobium cyanobacteriorum]MDF8332961.1 adenylate cyclase [Novosphingobium cyanobacteriorum]
MATAAAAHPSYSYTTDQQFFLRLSQVIAGLIVFGFAQWALRGFVKPTQVPLLIHVHGVVMLGWLAVLVAQNALAGSGNLALHRHLGWASVALVGAIVVLGISAGRMALQLHRVPPFFSDAFFLALTHVEVTAFAAMFATAVALRRQTQWHRRLMIGATVIVMEPAFGRLLPMELIDPGLGPWLEAALQAVFLLAIARHDRKVMGAVHPATLFSLAALLGVHALIQALAALPAMAAAAQAIATGA